MNPNDLCASIAASLPALFECSAAPLEGIRVRTPMLYPDGDVVDVFVVERDGGHAVTDFGDALGWLSMQSTTARRSHKQQTLIDDLCQTLGVELRNGQLTLRSRGDDALADDIVRLAQAVVRVSESAFHAAQPA